MHPHVVVCDSTLDGTVKLDYGQAMLACHVPLAFASPSLQGRPDHVEHRRDEEQTDHPFVNASPQYGKDISPSPRNLHRIGRWRRAFDLSDQRYISVESALCTILPRLSLADADQGGSHDSLPAARAPARGAYRGLVWLRDRLVAFSQEGEWRGNRLMPH